MFLPCLPASLTQGIFLDICPPGKESLFMSIVFTIDSVFFQFGRLLGFGCVHLLSIHTDSYTRLPYLIAITGVCTMGATFLLWVSYVPQAPKAVLRSRFQKRLDRLGRLESLR